MATLVQQDQTTIVEMDGQYDALDEALMDDLRDVLFSAVDRLPKPRLIIDMSRTDFLGSQVIGILVRVWKRTREKGGHMVLCGVSPICQQVLHVVHLDSVWDIVPDRQQALTALSSS